MRKLLLGASALMTSVALLAQPATHAPKLFKQVNYLTVEEQATHGLTPVVPPAPHRGGSRSITSTPIGNSGNPFSVLDNCVNQLTVTPATNQVVFIHRTNKRTHFGDDANNGQYRYDISRDGGTTWLTDRGLLNPSGTQAGFACRYPNGLVYNPAGNTNPDSSFLVYAGAFHDGSSAGNWNGYCVGRARLDNAPATYTEARWTPNSSLTNIMHGLWQSKPGVFWGIDVQSVDGTSHTALEVYKGIWSDDSAAVHWTALPLIVPPYDLSPDGKGHTVGYNIAFDPSGKYGWIGGCADMQDPTEATFDPFFYTSSDSGATWTGPILLNLDSIPGITYDPVNGPASSSFDVTLTVDGKGNPHLGVVVLPASATTPYSVLGAASDKYIYDITYDPTLGSSCQWRAIQLDYINSLRDPVDGTTAQLNMDNHLRSSRSPDGHKIFIGWVDSDSSFVGANGDNSSPDYKMVGIDVYANTKTAVRNFSSLDPTWGGQVLWPVAAPVASLTGSTYNIPTVFTKMTTPAVDSAAYYFYISNIEFSNSDFTQHLDNTAPDITVLGHDTMWVPVGSVYHDTGATAFDCIDGDLTSSIVVTNPVNTSSPGFYTVSYSVHDAAGNTATATRIVIVATAPICDFTITPDAVTTRKFKYIYTNPSGLAISWDWNYGDGSGKVRALSLEQHRYAAVTATTTYNVLFTARNPIGVCTKPATIVLNPDNSGYVKYGTDSTHFTGISSVSLNDYVNVYPNPAASTANIDLNINGLKEVQISIVNMMGQRVYSNVIADMSGEQMLNVDVSALAPGMYIVHIETDKGNAVKKLYVSRN